MTSVVKGAAFFLPSFFPFPSSYSPDNKHNSATAFALSLSPNPIMAYENKASVWKQDYAAAATPFCCPLIFPTNCPLGELEGGGKKTPQGFTKKYKGREGRGKRIRNEEGKQMAAVARCPLRRQLLLNLAATIRLDEKKKRGEQQETFVISASSFFS